MAWTNYQLLLAFVLIITGSINTLSVKWADETESVGVDGEKRPFDHPFFQANYMFLGELLCLFAFKILYKIYSLRTDGSEDVKKLTRGNRNFNPFILLLPAMCDMMGTSIMFIGLNLTYASSYQMFRGSVIIFVALLTIAFLRRMIKKYEWLGIFFVVLGLTLVGISDFLLKNAHARSHTPKEVITGDLLIVTAQILVATQMVVEEKYVSGFDIPPLQAVGWEGLFGFITLGLLQIPFYYIYVGEPFSNNPNGSLEDAIDAFVQIGNNWQLILAISCTVISIAFFNFAGISVTKEFSATTRMVLDSVRTVLIWIVGLLFLGEEFQWLQLVGFIVLLFGMFMYNNVTFRDIFVRLRSCYRCLLCKPDDNRENDDVTENRAADLPGDSNPA